MRFTINCPTDKVIITKKRVSQTQSKESDTVSETDISTFDEYIDMKVEEIVSKRNDIKNLNSFKKGIRNKLLSDDEISLSESEYSLFTELQTQKNNFQSTINDSQSYMIVLRDTEETSKEVSAINDKYEMVNIVTNDIITKTIYETINEYEEKRIDGFYWDKVKCLNPNKYKWVKI